MRLCRFTQEGTSCSNTTGKCLCLEAYYYRDYNSRINLDRLVTFTGVVYSKSGDDYKILCPFHIEKKPSCHLWRSSGKFYCFGCGVSGTFVDLVFAFVNKVSEGLLASLCEPVDASGYADMPNLKQTDVSLFALLSLKIKKAYQELPVEQALEYEKKATDVWNTGDDYEISKFLFWGIV